MSEMITSAANPLIKRVRALLGQRKHRQAEGAFVVEGIRAVWQALESDAEVEVLVVAPDLLRSDAARELLAHRQRAGLHTVEVSSFVFGGMTEREHPSGLAAIVRMPERGLAELRVGAEALFVALHEAGNPGNLGTILRTIDAVGGDGLIVVGDATDPYHPTSVKASMGALFTVPLVRVHTMEEVLAWCRSGGIGVVTTSAGAWQLHWEARYPRPGLLLMGSEGEGLAPEVLARGDLAVRIPMGGSADSLNLAVATGILLYEAKRPRIEHDPPAG